MFGKKGQASIEFFVTFSLAFIILLPIIYLFHNFSTKSSVNIAYKQINILGNDIVNAAEATFYMGNPARLTLQGSFPPGLTDIEIIDDWSNGDNELVFHFEDGQTMAFFSDVNINATIDVEDYSPGIKHILFETRNTSTDKYVNIDIY